MSYINHLHKTNSSQDMVHSQFVKIARILVSLIVVAIFCGIGWLFTRDKEFLISDSTFVILAESLIAIAVLVVLIRKATKIIEVTCIQRDKAIDALRENEAKFKSLVDASLVGIVEVNTDGSINVANDEFLRITGYTCSCLQAGKINWFDIVPSEPKGIDNNEFSQFESIENFKTYNEYLTCADGTQIKVKLSRSHLETGGRQRKYIFHVSECKQVEENLTFGQLWLKSLFDLMPMPLLLIEPGTAKVTFANQAADRMAGGKFPLAQSREDYSKLYRFADTEGKLIPSELSPLIRVTLGEKLEGVEINWYERDNVYPIKVFADTLPAISGYPATCIALFEDIDKLKRLEELLGLEKERFKFVFETTKNLIYSEQPEELIEEFYHQLAEQLDLDCYLYYLVDRNFQGIKLTSYSGITFSEAKDFQQYKFGEGISGTVAEAGYPINIENVSQYKDLDTQSIRNLGILAYYSCPLIVQEQLLGTISFASRTRSGFDNYEVSLMQAVCNQIAIAIERANLVNWLQKANRIKDDFLAIVSHELRSPLNSILGWAQYLQVRKLDEATTSRALESIERNSRELNHVIEELFDISQTIQGKMQLTIQNCNLASIIVTVIENLRSASLAKKLEVKLSIHKGLGMNEHIENAEFADTFERIGHLASLNKIPVSHEAILKNSDFLVAGDSQRLRQVMWNLLSNAIKFTSCGGCVEVRLLEEKTNDDELSYAVIQVSDTGMGINSEFLPYVFDRFRQGDSSSTRSHNGLGLGLSIVRHIVELHGGSVRVESPGVGEGSTFTVKLPLVKTTDLQSTKKKCQEKYVVIN